LKTEKIVFGALFSNCFREAFEKSLFIVDFAKMFFDGVFCHFCEHVFLIALFLQKNVLENFFIVKCSFLRCLNFFVRKKIFNFTCCSKNQIALTEKKETFMTSKTPILELLWCLEGSLFSYQINMFLMMTHKKKIQIPSISSKTKKVQFFKFFLLWHFLHFLNYWTNKFFQKTWRWICFQRKNCFFFLFTFEFRLAKIFFALITVYVIFFWKTEEGLKNGCFFWNLMGWKNMAVQNSEK
jgi:hypothetical protein